MAGAIAAAVALAACIAETTARTWTLAELIESAFANSRQTKQIQEELIKADALRTEASGGFLPRLDFAANYQYTIAQFNPIDFEGAYKNAGAQTPTLAAMGPFFDEFSAQLSDPIDHTTSFYLTLQQPLFAQTKILRRMQIVKHRERALLCVYQAAQQQVKALVIKLFYRALLAQKNEGIQNEAASLAEEGHRLSVLQFTVGKGSEIDTLRSRLHVEKTQIDQRNAEAARKLARRTLIKMSGIPESEATFLVDGDFPSEEYTVSLDDALASARKNNKGLGQLQSRESVTDLEVMIAKADFLPSLVAGASVGKVGQFEPGMDSRWQDDARVFVALKLNLFDGFGNALRVRQSLSEQRRFGWEKQQVHDSLELAVQEAWEGLETSRRVLAKSKALVNLAEKGYAASRDAYKVGAMTLLDFQRGELELNAARLSLNESQFAYHSAVVDLRVLMGNALVEGWQ